MKRFTLRNLKYDFYPCTIQGMKHFGERIKSLREAAGYSQEALADMAEFNRSNYISIEKGRRPAPDSLLQKLEVIYGIPFAQLELERDTLEVKRKFKPEVILKAAKELQPERWAKHEKEINRRAED